MQLILLLFFFNDTATTQIYTLSLHDALPISGLALKGLAQQHSKVVGQEPFQLPWRGEGPVRHRPGRADAVDHRRQPRFLRSEEHTSELQSQFHLVCRLLLEKKKKKTTYHHDQ